MSKPSIPKGTRDFGPNEMAKRNYIFDTIKACFKKYGFAPIETPAMETTQTLLGKYGEEGDRLIFKIQPRGDKFKSFIEKIMNTYKVQLDDDIETEIPRIPFDKINPVVLEFAAEEALRYDLTVPFARYVVQHQNEISFPFKRYQIQPVWRADRPQKGRYREFYQCDADMIGSNSLLNEIDLILLMEEVFGKLKIPVTIKLNNRKILSGLAEVTGEQDKLIDITVAIDKLDKIGEEKVIEEMKSKNISDAAIEKIKPILSFKGNTEEKFKLLEGILSSSEIGMKGIEELKFIFDTVSAAFDSNNLPAHSTQAAILDNPKPETQNSKLELDIALARGLNYYTGAIIEVKSNSEFSPSICGGGRYDDLTGIFGLPNMSGVGISFGADRIYDVMNDMNLFPENNDQQTQLLFINFGEAETAQCLKLLVQARQENINAELYPDNAKMAKQMKYANDKKIPFAALMGSNEMKEGKITIKNMESGEQQTIDQKDLISILKK